VSQLGFLRNAIVTGGAAVLLLIGVVVAKDDGHDTLGTWLLMGHDLSNSRSQPSEKQIGLSNVAGLVPKWTFTTGGDVSATPTVAADAVYFPDWAGNLYAVRADNGQKLWSHQIADYNHRPGSMSRVSPAVFNDELIAGDNMLLSVPHDGAHMMAVDRFSGELRWITQVDADPAAIITGSPVVSGNVVYVGISSNEEAQATSDAYACCTFRGSMVALNAFTGALLWKTYVVPENGGKTDGYSGNAIWQPPVVDAARGLIYIGTGNNYTVPKTVLDCEKTGRQDCTSAEDHFDTALALDLKTGTIKWAHRLQGFDTWTVACTSAPPGVNCPLPSSPDYDLGGSGPNLVGNIVGFGQKSGIYWALNPDTGDIVWSTIVGPGSTLGGLEWGTATDGARIYAAITNKDHVSYKLQPNGPTITWGSWAALDVGTGKVLWQVADPTPGATDMGSVSVANGIVYAASFTTGIMYALHAVTGNVLWQFDSGGSVVDGPSIMNGTLFWGSGYSHIKPGIANNKVFAFAPPKNKAKD
jgi:polyvinyl alcohol dehydrogenase (cytochrome)